MIKSRMDTRQYKHLTLSNGLKCLLISDPGDDRSAAALSVNVGGYDAPKDIPGLAHLLEHMLFFGSVTYPKENYFSEYITLHGGSTNASTGSEKTTYHFNIFAEYFDHALDVFSHFFIDPIFNENMIDREINAVDSEFYTNFNNDRRKRCQVLKSLIDDDYPATNFSCGNKKTLCVPNLYKRMMEFYSNHYRASKMYLVVSSKGSVESLEKMVIDKFSTILNNVNTYSPKRVKIISATVLPYDDFLKTTPDVPYIKLESGDNNHKLFMFWQLPPTLKKYKTKIDSFWKNILDHECENSLYSYFRDKLYTTSLTAGAARNNNFDIFEIALILTNYGHTCVWHIIRTIRCYMEKLLNISDSDIIRIYNETKKIDWINFNNNSKQNSKEYVLDLVNDLDFLDDDLVLCGEYFLQDINEQVIDELKEYIGALFVTKPIIFHSSPTYSGEMLQKKEIYYDTRYQIDWIPHIWTPNNCCAEESCKNIIIPGPNPYIPENFILIESKESNKIQKISSTALGELWYKLDTEFKQPKIKMAFKLILGEQVVKNKALCDLYIEILNDTLKEKLYPAKLSNNHCLIIYDQGINIRVYGYSDKILHIWSLIIDVIKNFKCNVDQFNRKLENEKSEWLAFESCNTQVQLDHHICELYSEDAIYYKDAIEYLNSITHDDLIQFEKHVYDNCYYIGLFQGNGTTDQYNIIKDLLHQMFDAKNTSQFVDGFPKILKTPSFENTMIRNYEPFNKKEIDVNSSTVTIYDLENNHFNEDKNSLLSNIFVTIVNESFFDKLRTQKQLGYNVNCSSFKYQFLDKNNGGIKFTIQSSAHGNEYLQEQINEFLKNIFESIDQKSFDTCVQSILTESSQPFQSLPESFAHNFANIVDRTFMFDSTKKIEVAKQLKYSDLLQYVTDYIVNNQRKIIINVN